VTAVKLAIRQAHIKNIERYRRLLKTDLPEVERQFIEHRIALEEQAEFQAGDGLQPSRLAQKS